MIDRETRRTIRWKLLTFNDMDLKDCPGDGWIWTGGRDHGGWGAFFVWELLEPYELEARLTREPGLTQLVKKFSDPSI